jgi:hypothetical protein
VRACLHLHHDDRRRNNVKCFRRSTVNIIFRRSTVNIIFIIYTEESEMCETCEILLMRSYVQSQYYDNIDINSEEYEILIILDKVQSESLYILFWRNVKLSIYSTISTITPQSQRSMRGQTDEACEILGNVQLRY